MIPVVNTRPLRGLTLRLCDLHWDSETRTVVVAVTVDVNGTRIDLPWNAPILVRVEDVIE